MAYLKRFSGLLAILLILAVLQGSANIVNSADIDIEETRQAYREVPLSKYLRNSSTFTTKYYAEKLDAFGIHLRPGNEFRTDSKPTVRSAQKCKSIVYRTLMKLPRSHRSQVRELTLFYTEDGRRGLSGNSAIVLRCLNVSDGELASVLIHEIGHLVDSTFLTGADTETFSGFYDFDAPVAMDDESLAYYKISWNSESEKKEKASEIDFCSRYGMSDPFEDFAECYTMYRLHGPEFRQMKKTSYELSMKYEFMKNKVFEDREFGEETGQKINIKKRNYDVTVLPFQLKEIFG